MNILRTMLAVFVVTALVVAFGSPAKADDLNQMTTFTFSAPVELPGIALPAGTYVFKLAATTSNHTVVQVFDKNQKRVYATFLAIRDWRDQPSDKTVVRFSENAAGAPAAIKEWFYPSNNYGFEFVYPRSRAIALAKASNQAVPSMPEPLTGDITSIKQPASTSTESGLAELNNAPIKAEQPTGQEVETAEAFVTEAPGQQSASTNPTHNVNTESTSNNAADNSTTTASLPKTASMLPFLLLSGFCLMTAGGLLWFISRRTA